MSIFSKTGLAELRQARERFGNDKINVNGRVSAYGGHMSISDANKIYDYNADNKQRGIDLDSRRADNQKIVINKNGVIDFKKTLRLRLPQSWKSILGIK